MFRRITFISLLLCMTFLLASCSAFGVKKHLERAEVLERRGMQLQSNAEYIRALRGVGDYKTKVEIAKKIANNYRKANRMKESVQYYQEAIRYANRAKLPAPYVDLAETYLLEGEKGLGSASALLEEIDVSKPIDAAKMQASICRMLGDLLMNEGNYIQAKFYYDKMKGYAEILKDETLLTEVKLKIRTAEERKNGGPMAPQPEQPDQPEQPTDQPTQ